MKFKMVHTNFNVKNVEESLKFYKEALGLEKTREINGEHFKIVYVGNENAEHVLELTQLFDHPQSYDLGENEIHLAFRVDDFEAAYKMHKDMGCICYENKDMGIYFIEDPDGYWLEVIPTR